jgi:hypothetical protein
MNEQLKALVEELAKRGFKGTTIPVTLEDIQKWEKINQEVNAFLEAKDKQQKESEHAFDHVQFKGQ